MLFAISMHRTERPAIDAATIRRRPPRVRSRKGPSTGATTAKGAIVNRRYSSTLGRAAPTPTSKKSEPASDTVTKASPAVPTAWATASRANGVNVVDSRWVRASVAGQGTTPGRPRPGEFTERSRARADPGANALSSPYHWPMKPPETSTAPDGPLYLNRELSMLEFQARVLALAEDPSVPLLERAKFLAIFAGNVDEFFQVRIAGLKEQLSAGVRTTSPDGLDQVEQLRAIRTRVEELITRQAAAFTKEIGPALQEAGVAFTAWNELEADEQAQLTRVFDDRIFPVLTPLAVDPAHPFPYISNLSLNLAVVVRDRASAEERI